MTRKELDDAFPTVVRYVGVVLAIILVVAAAFGRGDATLASGGVLALGMILYKTVRGAVNGD